MAKQCEICKVPTIFYIWASSRNFNRNKMLKVFSNLNKMEEIRYQKGDYTVCFHCAEKYKLME